MSHINVSSGRDRTASSRPEPELRWRLLDDLTEARAHYGLKDRTLQVLRALLSFLPRGERVDLVVFPSNRTLSTRLLGMPESTLRRHLSLLCDQGLIARRDSPNRKRFRVGRQADLTFGLDLSPLFAATRTIRDNVDATRRDAAERRETRARIMTRLADMSPDDVRHVDARRLLRRRLTADELGTLLIELCKDTETSESSARDGENGRHIQHQDRTETSTVIAEAVLELGELTGRRVASARELETAGHLGSLALATLPSWQSARTRLGPVWAALALVYLNRRADVVRAPNRYIAELARRAMNGRFDITEALTRTARKVDCSQHGGRAGGWNVS